jgi:hypothetical protein
MHCSPVAMQPHLTTTMPDQSCTECDDINTCPSAAMPVLPTPCRSPGASELLERGVSVEPCQTWKARKTASHQGTRTSFTPTQRFSRNVQKPIWDQYATAIPFTDDLRATATTSPRMQRLIARRTNMRRAIFFGWRPCLHRSTSHFAQSPEDGPPCRMIARR